MRPLAISILLVSFLASLPAGIGQEDALQDPLSIKRVLIPAGRLPAELEKVRQGVLVSMPRPDFEARVQKAARARQALRNPPRLIKAEYRAVLDGISLINGRGEWTVLNPSSEAGILPVRDLNLSLEKVKTKDNTEAVIGDLDGKSLGILIEKTGMQPIFFDWTLRGLSSHDGLQFEVKVPPCALSVLELAVPADQIVTTRSSSAILSGPHESEIPQQRKWRLHSAGRSQIDLMIRRKSGPGSALMLSQVQSKQQLDAGRCQADFDFRLELLRGSAEEFSFICDPELEPYAVSGKNVDIKGWELQNSKQPGKKTLVVHLREPFQGKVAGLQIRCLASVKGDGLWTSPGMHLQGGIDQGETLKLTVEPELRLGNWQTGQFRLFSTANEGNGAQTLTLLGSAREKGTRPGGTIKVQGVDFLAQQKSWWQIGPLGSTLTADFDLEVHRGKLFQLSLLLPAGWRAESAALDPAENLGAWSVSGNRLIVNFQRAIVPGMPAHLRLRLSSAAGRQVAASGLIVDFPDVRIMEPSLRSGVLAIGVNAPYQAAVLNSSLPAASENAGPWKSSSPQFFFPFKNEPVAGKLRLVPYRDRVQARCTTDVLLVPGGATLQVHLEVEPIQGNPRALNVYLSAPLPDGWQWKTEANQIVKQERLPLADALPALLALGTYNPLEKASLQALLPRGQHWRLVLAKPLDAKQHFLLQSTLPSSGLRPVEVPLVWIPDAGLDGTVSLNFAGTELVQVKRTGLREDSENRVAGPKTRRFLYEPRHHLPRLILTSHPKAEEKNDREICDQAELTTLVGSDGRLLHQFRFRVWNWRQSSLPLVLPANTEQVVGARVDGRWLGQVPQQRRDGLHVVLTVPPDGPVHQFEILYAAAAPGLSWPGWARLESPAPRLPISPLSLRRHWRLPAGMEPLESSFVCVTEPNKNGPVLTRIQQAWHGADPWLAALGLSMADDWATPQRQLMINSEAAIRQKLSAERLLGEALQCLAVDGLGSQATLVVDAEAFEAAGLEPTIRVSAAKKSESPFWESAGLIYVPCSGAPLLTTKVKLESWKTNNPRATFADSVAPAVTEAAIHGQDRSGRFHTLDYWLSARHASDDSIHSFFRDIGQDLGWTEWQPVAGMVQPERMVVIQRSALDLSCLALAVICTMLAWRLGSRISRAWYFRMLVMWLAAGALALVWVPPVFRTAIALVFLPALLFAVPAYVRWLFRRGPRKNGSIVKPASTVAALLLLLMPFVLSPTAMSGGAQSFTVLLVQGGEDESQIALVEPELLKKLDELAGRAGAALTRPVLTKARYLGTVNGSTVDFQAELECFSFADKSTLIIPLDGVDLKDGAILNGRPDQFPVAVQAGYALPLTEKGFQKLTLKFSVRLSGTGPSKELRFSMPKLAQTQLELTLPKDVQEIQALGALGDQRIMAKGDKQILQARLGRESAVQVRWRSGPQAVPAAQVQIREMYYWDLRTPAPLLNAILEYSVKKGILPGVAVALPEGLEVRSVEVGSETPENVPAPRLKTWRLLGKDGNRTLHVDFHQPVTASVQIKLGLVPRLSPALTNLALELPYPLQVKQDGFLEGFLAYRFENQEARESQQNLGAIGIDPQVFSKAWRAADPRAAVAPTRAFSFRRDSPKSALRMAIVSPVLQISQDVSWQVGSHNSDWTLVCDLTSQTENLMLVEWQVPPGVVLAAVNGPEVRHWSRAGALVQVWLTVPQKKTKLHLSGWAKNPQALAGGNGRFDLPALTLKDFTPATTVHVTPLPGISLQPVNLQNLTRSGEEGPGAFSFVTTKQQAGYGGSFLLAATPVQPDVDILTISRIRNRALHFTTHIDCRVPHGEISQLVVQMDRWSGSDVHLDVVEFSARVVPKKFKDGHSWIVHLPPGMPRHFSCRLTGRGNLPTGSKVSLPDVSVSGARQVQRFVALVSPDFAGEPLRSLTPLKDVPEELARWPAEAKQILGDGAAWRIMRADWMLQVTPRATPVAAAVQVLLAEQEAAIGDDGRWIHQATFQLFAKGDAEVHLTLPGDARLLALAVDGQSVSPRQKTPETVWLPLPGTPGPHRVQLRWQFQKDESITRPNLATPTIEGIRQRALQGTVHIPAGFDVTAAPPAADLMYRRAAAQLELSRRLGEIIDGKPKLPIDAEQKLRDSQKRFAWYCRQAEIQATRSGLPRRTVTDLRKQNDLLMRKLDRDKIRVDAEKEVVAEKHLHGREILSLPTEGRVISWRGDGQNSPRLVLTPGSQQDTQNGLLATEVLLLILVALGILSCLPRIFAWLPQLWPEQVLLLAWLGWYFLGASAIGLALLLIGFSARIILTLAWLQRLVHRGTPTSPGSTLHVTG